MSLEWRNKIQSLLFTRGNCRLRYKLEQFSFVASKKKEKCSHYSHSTLQTVPIYLYLHLNQYQFSFISFHFYVFPFLFVIERIYCHWHSCRREIRIKYTLHTQNLTNETDRWACVIERSEQVCIFDARKNLSFQMSSIKCGFSFWKVCTFLKLQFFSNSE